MVIGDMMKKNISNIQAELKIINERLNMYYEKEKYMLSKSGIQSYGIGARNVARYNIDLDKIYNIIDSLKKEKKELESIINGGSARKAIGIVPRDEY